MESTSVAPYTPLRVMPGYGTMEVPQYIGIIKRITDPRKGQYDYITSSVTTKEGAEDWLKRTAKPGDRGMVTKIVREYRFETLMVVADASSPAH